MFWAFLNDFASACVIGVIFWGLNRLYEWWRTHQLSIDLTTRIDPRKDY